jgi:hypothetical protein
MKKRGKKDSFGKIKGFSIQFLPFSEVRYLDTSERIKKILKILLGNNILIIQGRLKTTEETRLIEDTMAMIDHVEGFKGIEIAVIENGRGEGIFEKLKKRVANALVGGDLGAVTILGPATIVKEIKRDPKKIELMLNK